MKRTILYIILSLPFLGCESMLDISPRNSVTFENAFLNEKELETGILSMEYAFRNNIGNFQYENVRTRGCFSDFHVYWDQAILQNEARVYLSQWNIVYNIIAAANVPLPYIDKLDMPQIRKDFYKGCVLFTKALCYFELIRKWGDCVVVYDEVAMDPIPKQSWVKVANYAIGMAEEAVRLLPEFPDVKDSNGNKVIYKSRPSKGAANALLAHLCAWKAGCKYFAQPQEAGYDDRALWEKAEKACTALIESGIYALAATPEEVCTKTLLGGDKESIYETVFKDFWHEVGLPTMAFCFGADYETYPIIPGKGKGDIKKAQYRIKNETVRGLFPTRIEGGKSVTDLRRDAYFHDFEDMEKEAPEITGGYAYPRKWRYVRVGTSGWQTGRFINFDQNRIWWRLADIILLRAECRTRLGNSAGAIEDLNTVRRRAHAAPYRSSEYGGDLRYAVFKEREKELLMEGHRYYDVVRNGYSATELYGGFRNLSLQDMIDGAFFDGIGSEEFRNNPLARQNTFWLKRL